MNHTISLQFDEKMNDWEIKVGRELNETGGEGMEGVWQSKTQTLNLGFIIFMYEQ